MIPNAPSHEPGQLFDTTMGPVWVVDKGEGPPLVSIHGVPGSIRDFRWLAACVEGPLRFVRFDLPGYAQTPLQTMSETSFDARADFVLALADELGIERFAVVGHSMGGGVAMHVAARAPDRVAGVVLLASVGLRVHRGLRKIPNMKRLSSIIRTIPGAKWPLGLIMKRGLIQAGFSPDITLQEATHAIHTIAAFDLESLGQAAHSLNMPCFVSWADDDPFIEREVAMELSKVLPKGPRMPFATGGHNIQKHRAVELGSALIEWVHGLS